RGGERVRSFDPQHECLARRATHQRLQTFLGTTYELDGPAAALDVDDLLDRFAEPLPVRIGVHPGIILPTVCPAPPPPPLPPPPPGVARAGRCERPRMPLPEPRPAAARGRAAEIEMD